MYPSRQPHLPITFHQLLPKTVAATRPQSLPLFCKILNFIYIHPNFLLPADLWSVPLRQKLLCIPHPSSNGRSPYFKLLLTACIGYSAKIQRVSINSWVLDGPPVLKLHLLTPPFSSNPCSSCAPTSALCCCPDLTGRSGSFQTSEQ